MFITTAELTADSITKPLIFSWQRHWSV